MSIQKQATIKSWFETGDTPTQQQFYDWIESSVKKDVEVHVSTINALSVTKSTNTLTATSNGSFQIAGVTYGVGSLVLVRHGLAIYQGVYEVTTSGDGSNPYVLTRMEAFNTDDTLHNITVKVRDNAYSSLFKLTVNTYVQGTGNLLNTAGVTVVDIIAQQINELFPYTAGVQINNDVDITQGNNAALFVGNGLWSIYGNGTPAFEYSDTFGSLKALVAQQIQAQFAFKLTGSAGNRVRFIVEGTGINSTTFDRALFTKDFELGAAEWYVEIPLTHFLNANESFRIKAYAILGDVNINYQSIYKYAWETYKATMVPISVGGGGGGSSDYIEGTGNSVDLSANRTLNSFTTPTTTQPVWANASEWLAVAHVAMYIQLSANLQLPLINEGNIKWKLARQTNTFVLNKVNMLDFIKKGDTVEVAIHQFADDASLTEAVITGGSNEGDTLTASYTFTGAGTLQNITYQWKNNGSNIGGATSSTYSGQLENDNISVVVGGEMVLGGVVIPLTSVESSQVLIGASGGGSDITIGVYTNGYTGTPSGQTETGDYAIAGSNQTRIIRLLNAGNKISFTYNIPTTANYLIKARVRIGSGSSNWTNYQGAYKLTVTPNAGSPTVKTTAYSDHEAVERSGTVVGIMNWGNIITQSVINLPSGSTTFEIEMNTSYPAGVIDEVVLIPQS